MRRTTFTLLAGLAFGCASDPEPGAGEDETGTTSADATSLGEAGEPPADDTTSVDPAGSSDGGSSTAAGDPACDALRSELEEVAAAYHDDLPLVGLSVAMETGGCAAWSTAWGVADVAADTPLTPEHLLRAGSVTKSYTAALILKLTEEGLLSLDDTLGEFAIDIPSADQITIRQLLNHTSGLADYQNNPAFGMAANDDPGRSWTPQELIDFTVDLGAVGAPGAAHAYSNANYVLAALVAEEVTGVGYAEALRTRVLDPNGLQHTYLEDEETWREPMAIGYVVSDGGMPVDSSGLYHGSSVWSSGALVATAEDVRAWMSRLLSSDFLDAESQAALAEFVPDPATGGYGLGIFEAQAGGITAFGHNGAVLGFQAAAFVHPGSGASVSVLHNQLGLSAAGGLASDPTALALELLSVAAAQ
ncbi:MAG: serine hydrolase domain-containing protein [Myxococcota bacterium]